MNLYDAHRAMKITSNFLKPEAPVIHPDLLVMLNQASRSPEDQIAKIVTADKADDLNNEQVTPLGQLLRWLARNQKMIMFTGSRCYGDPTDESDFVWVVCASHDERKQLREFADSHQTPAEAEYGELAAGQYEGMGDFDEVFRFGPVNLIVVSEDHQWRGWQTGTDFLMMHKPRSKDRSKQIIRASLNYHYEKVSSNNPHTDPWGVTRIDTFEHFLEDCDIPVVEV